MAPGQLEQAVRTRLQELGSSALQGTVSAAGAATGAILQLIVMIGSFHVSLIHGAWLHDQILVHSPLGTNRTQTLLEATRQMIRASFYGVVAVAAAQGTLLGVAAWIADLPIPGLWGLIAAAVSVLPILGSALVWIPGTILLFAQGKSGMAIFFLVWGAVLVANSDNVVRPLVVMNSLQEVNGLLVFIAILGGIQAFGFTGVLAGPVTLAVGIALLHMLREELASERES
jgi:predicted PurR-regulated permease PerM